MHSVGLQRVASFPFLQETQLPVATSAIAGEAVPWLYIRANFLSVPGPCEHFVNVSHVERDPLSLLGA